MKREFVTDTYVTADQRETAASLPPAERQRRIKHMLIRTPTFNTTVKFLQEQHMPVPGGSHDTGRICGILGASRTGKSYALAHYTGGLGNVQSKNAIVGRALVISCGKRWTSLMFATATKEAAKLPMPRKSNAANMLADFTLEVVRHGVELVVIDDVQFMFAQANKTSEDVSGFIIRLAEQHSCNVILSGTEPIDIVVRADEHMYGRGAWPVHRLDAYGWRTEKTLGEFCTTLDVVDDMLPFRRRAELVDPFVSAHLYHVSGGKIGLALEYVRSAAYKAIAEKSDTVTVEHLRAAAAVRRKVGDPYEPFVSAIDLENPGDGSEDEDREEDDAIRARFQKREPLGKKRGPKGSKGKDAE